MRLVRSCEGCGGTQELEQIRGETLHRRCAPKEWRETLEENERFLREAHRREQMRILEPDDPFKRRRR